MLIRHTILYLPAQILGPFAQFVAIVIFTHWMTPGPYGVLTYVMASQDFVFLLCLSWWSQYTIRYFGGQTSREDAEYRRSEFTIILGSIVLQVLASMFVLLAISTPITPALSLTAVVYMVTRCLSLHLGERARSRGRIFDYTMATSAGPIFGLAFAFLAVAIIAPTPVSALAGYCIAQGASLVWLVLQQDIDCRLRRPDRALVWQALSFGLPLIAAGLAAWVSMNGIRIIVDHEISAEALGLIAVGWGLGHRLMATASMLVTAAAFPLAVESFRSGSKDTAYQQIVTNGILMFGIVLPAAVGIYLLQAPLVSLLVAAPFRAMTLAILPAALAAGLFRNVRTHVADQVFILIERTSVVCVMNVAEAICVISGCILGLRWDGSVGAAIGSAAGYGVTMVANFIVAHESAKLHIPYKHVGFIIVATALMTMVVTILPEQTTLPGGAISRIGLVSTIGAVTYLIAITLLFPVVADGLKARFRRSAARMIV